MISAKSAGLLSAGLKSPALFGEIIVSLTR